MINNNFDDWIRMLVKVFSPAHNDVLLLTKQAKTSTDSITVYWPESYEEQAVGVANLFGIVVIDEKEFSTRIIPTWMLHYAFNVLVYGGRLVIVDGQKILTIIENGDLANKKETPRELVESV